MKNKYEDMLYLPHHVSLKHPHMSRKNRAAQFAPFAAVVGHEASVYEAARYTEEKIELDEGQKEQLNYKLAEILNKAEDERKAAITYFVKDKRKAGGRYVSAEGLVKKFDENKKVIVMKDGRKIYIGDVYGIKI